MSSVETAAIGSATCVETIDASPYTPTSRIRECVSGGPAQGDESIPSTPPVPPIPSTPPVPSGGIPGESNTGVPANVATRVVNGDVRITTAGMVIDGQDIRGRVIVQAPNVTIRNSIIRGPAEGFTKPGFLVTNWGYPNLQITDTEIAATTATSAINGIAGNNYTLTRVDIHNVIDSTNILGDNVTIQNSWLHDNLFYLHDPIWNGDSSHSDSIQIQNGANIIIRDNLIDAGYNAGVQVTQDRGPMSNFSFTGNVADGGGCTINIAEGKYGPPQGVSIAQNKFGRSTRLKDCAIIASNTTKAAMRVTENYYIPDNSVVTVRRGG